jgi:hypothetical protein
MLPVFVPAMAAHVYRRPQGQLSEEHLIIVHTPELLLEETSLEDGAPPHKGIGNRRTMGFPSQ